ncbi:signal peptidase II [Candidatus Woesearchaeota archaeon]|nr:signal peptidase II [Candidatus Woesearchaeota archaeon]
MVTAIKRKNKNSTKQLRVDKGAVVPLLLALGLVAALVAADQLTKELIRKNLTHPFQLGLLQITHTTNTGSVFGLFPGSSSFIVAVSIVVIPVLVVIYMKRLMSHGFQRAAVVFIAAGLFGNTIDRLFRGAVTDFIYIGPWPAFNLADSFLFIGAVLLVAPYILRHLPQLRQRLRK